MDTTQKSKIVDLRWTPFENSDAMSTSPKAVIASSSSVVAVWDKLSWISEFCFHFRSRKSDQKWAKSNEKQ